MRTTGLLVVWMFNLGPEYQRRHQNEPECDAVPGIVAEAGFAA